MDTRTLDPVRTITIEGMSCNHCVSRVNRALAAVDGIKVVDVALGRATVLVSSEEAVQRAVAALADLGYTARPEGSGIG
jgi:copper chaperone CopZ